MSTTPLEVVRAAYAALAAKDLDGVLALCHPDVVLTQDPALPWGGRYAGTAHASGKACEISECHVWTVVDGRVTRARFFIDTAAMLDALAP